MNSLFNANWIELDILIRFVIADLLETTEQRVSFQTCVFSQSVSVSAAPDHLGVTTWENVTWYHQPRVEVYFFHTLSTFLTALTRELFFFNFVILLRI